MIRKIEKTINYYKFLNYNYEKYLETYNPCLNESYYNNNEEFKAYFQQHFIHPYKICDEFTYENFQRGLYETLKTHDPDIFYNKLFDKFLSVSDIEYDAAEDGIAIKDALYVWLYNLNEINEIKSFCQLYGYAITNKPVQNGSRFLIIIEATYGYTSKNKVVYEECNGILYHITTLGHLKKIMKIGLIAKHLDKKVSHPGRIYFSTESDIQELAYLGKQLYPLKRFAILKIDLSKMPYKTKPNFYIDPAYSKFGVFTCENISPACISIIYPKVNTKDGTYDFTI